MQQAIALAQLAGANQEVPIGAVLVHKGKIIGEGYNQPIKLNDPSAHAEIIAIRSAGQALKNYRLLDTTLYTTLEPCVMCAGAIVHARIKKVIYAAPDPRFGAIHSAFSLNEENQFNHHVEYHAGLLALESSQLIKEFFKNKRETSIHS